MTWNPDYNPPTAQRTSKPLPRLASETTADNPWPVSLLSEKFYTAVERWPSVWVAGQITQINTRRQGSAYITLRDDFEDIAMEVNGFGRFAAAASQFVQGDRVVIHGKPNLWMKRTSLSLRGDTILKVGAGGSLKAMIDELRKQLKARPVRRRSQTASPGVSEDYWPDLRTSGTCGRRCDHQCEPSLAFRNLQGGPCACSGRAMPGEVVQALHNSMPTRAWM